MQVAISWRVGYEAYVGERRDVEPIYCTGMSRHIHKIEEGHVAYGLDHVIGYFLQVFNYKGDCVHEMETNNPFSDTPCHRVDIATYLKNCGVPKKVWMDIALDLPI